MILTSENYYSREADQEYLSVSQYKNFCGTPGRPGCEEQALALLNGGWERKETTSMLVGSYVDAHFEGTLPLFRAHHPEIFTRTGDLRSDYRRAEEVINRIERDEYFMLHMQGQKQVIMTGEMFGAKWKIKMDSYFPGTLIVDLKCMKSLREANWVKDSGYMNFVTYWGYDIQGAVYQKIVEINTGKKLPVKIAAASKEEYPDIEVIQIEQSLMDAALEEVEQNVPKILALKAGEIEPLRCELCDYCRHTRVLTHSIWSEELLGEV